MRHSFVWIMSDGGVSMEAIADLCGHSSPAVTGQVYRHQLRPVISRGARVADSVFGTASRRRSAGGGSPFGSPSNFKIEKGLRSDLRSPSELVFLCRDGGI
nr:hypothetical protein [Actinomadura latina]